MDLVELLKQAQTETIVKAILSDPRQKTYTYTKTIVWRIDDEESYYQFEAFTQEQAFHTNVKQEELIEQMAQLASHYKQIQIITLENEWALRISKKGKVHVTKRQNSDVPKARKHNVEKAYILKEGQPVDFLIHLGIMEASGRVKKKWYDKFRQINRYLEFIEDSLNDLGTDSPTIIDFGCGKSYLTFALYYYLVEMKKINATIIGLDLKESVIYNLNILRQELGYKQLDFRVGDIAMFEYDAPIDMVISLHACNLATDYALEKAVKWNAKVIMAVPCCHKEIYQQMQIKPMEGILQYGLLKERMAALMTDGLRGEILKSYGYEVQIMEFIDMEHTPKNIMIRAYKRHEKSRLSKSYLDTCRDYHLQPTLERLLWPD
jgi:SAM-dependent methyltransferase